jgi:hypothetical protein
MEEMGISSIASIQPHERTGPTRRRGWLNRTGGTIARIAAWRRVRGLTTRDEIGENAFLHAGGGVAQLGEHHVRNVGVEGSIPFSSTTFSFSTTN